MSGKDKDKSTDRSAASGAEHDEKAIDDRTFTFVDTALRVQRPAAAAYVRSLRAKNPGMSDDELVAHIESRFKNIMTATGAGVGGAAALPGVGTVAAMALGVGDGAAFAEACAFLTLAVAEIRGVDMRDADRRRAIALGVLSGDKGAQIMGKALGRQGTQWESVLNGVAPDFMVNAASRQFARWARRKVLARLGGVWAGRLVPFGVGAVIGGVGNRGLAKSVIEAEREIFSHASPRIIDGTPSAGALEG